MMTVDEQKLLTERRYYFQNLAYQYKEKLVYYLIALSVTAIGFSVYKTADKGLKLIQIPLGVSVLLWAISILSGLLYLSKRIEDFVNSNDVLLMVELSTHNQEALAKAVNAQKYAEIFRFVQTLLFCAGVISFIVWHVLEMYSSTIFCH